jgi:hypothetical protein
MRGEEDLLFKKFLAAVAFSAISLTPMLSQAATYPSNFSSTVEVLIPVSCSFVLPGMSFGAISYGLGTSYDTDATGAAGSCNVNWTAAWSSTNGLTADKSNFDGTLTGNDNNGNSHSLAYVLTVPFTGGSANVPALGNFHVHIPMGNAYGGVQYSDNVVLTINY